MLINPAPGLRIRDPETKQVIEDGHIVSEHDMYWAARLRDGDVVLADAIVAEPKKPKPTTTLAPPDAA